MEYTCKTQIDVQSLIDVKSSNIWPFLTNRRPILRHCRILQMTSHPLGHGFETMMEKGQG